MLGDLLRPFAYLTIRHESRLPLLVNWVVPSLIVALLFVGSASLGLRIDLFRADGVVDRLLSFVQTLAGFYIAALAAVSSFNSPHLDRRMPQPAPTIRVKYQGGLEKVELTRRRFLTSMFAFLTALSFVFSLSAIAALTVAQEAQVPGGFVAAVCHSAGAAWFLFLMAQMTCITFWGLYYLGERILTPD